MKRWCYALILCPVLARAAAVASFNYQARLSDTDGNPLNGSYAVDAAIYDAPTGGTRLFSESHPGTPVVNGVFNVVVGAPASVFQGGTARYLEISINGTVLSPRRPFGAAPYARGVAADAVGAAELAANAVGAAGLADGAVTGAAVLDGSLTNAHFTSTASLSLSKLAADPSVSGTINQAGNPVDWTRLKNVPSSWSDGTDAAGPTISLAGATVVPQASSVNFTGGGFTVANGGSGRADVALDPAVVTLAGNAVNGPNALVRLNGAGVLPSSLGGTGANLSGAGAGGVPYFTATGVLGALPVAADGLALKMVAGRPAWATDLAGPPGSVSGSGTIGFLPTWTGAGASAGLGLSDVFQSTNGNVGILTTAPSARLEVANGNQNGLSNGSGFMVLGSTGARNLVMDTYGPQARNAGTAAPVVLNPQGGNVGYNMTSAPAHTFDVNGDLNIGSLCFSGDCRTTWPVVRGLPTVASNNALLTYDPGTGWYENWRMQNTGTTVSWNPQIPLAGERFTAETVTLGSTTSLHMSLGRSALDMVQVGNGGAVAPLLLQPQTGNVGVGIANPAFTVDAATGVYVDRICIGAACRTAWPADSFPAQTVVLARVSNYNGVMLSNPGDTFTLPFDQVDADRLGEFTPGPTGRFVPQATGIYNVCMSASGGGCFPFAEMNLKLGAQRIRMQTRDPILHGCTTVSISAGTVVQGEIIIVDPPNTPPCELYGNPSDTHVSVERMR